MVGTHQLLAGGAAGGWLAKLFGGRLVVGGNKSLLNFTK